MRKSIRKIAAWILCSTIVLTSSGNIALAKTSDKLIAQNPKNSFEVSPNDIKDGRVLYITKEMGNATGNLMIKDGIYERVIIARDVDVKKVTLNNVTTKEIIIESGTTCTVEVIHSTVKTVEVIAPQLEAITFEDIVEMLNSGMGAAEVVDLYNNYLKEKATAEAAQPKIIVQGKSKIDSVKMSGNASMNLTSANVENVEIKSNNEYGRLTIALTGYHGNLHIEQNKDNKSDAWNLLLLDLKDSELKEVTVTGSKNNTCSINSRGKSKVGNLEVKGNSSISLGVATDTVKLDKESENASIRVYSSIKDIVVEGNKNNITLTNNAKVENAVIKGDSTKISGNGTLDFADITGNNANVSTSGTTVSGTNNSTPPAGIIKPSFPIIPPNPTEKPDPTPTMTPTPTPDAGEDVTPTPTPDAGEDVTPTPTPDAGEDVTPTLPENNDVSLEWGEDNTLVVSGLKNTTSLLTSLVLANEIGGYPVSSIKAGAFKNNTTLEDIYISGAIAIGASAFEGNSALKTISIGKDITSIGDRAFAQIGSTKTVSGGALGTASGSAMGTASGSAIGTASRSAITINIAMESAKNISSSAFEDAIGDLIFYVTDAIAEFLEKIKGDNNWTINRIK